MHLRFIQLALFACFSFLLVPSAIAEPQPSAAPATPTVPPIKPPPTPTPPDFIVIDPPEPPPTPPPPAAPTPNDPGPTPFPTPWQPPTPTPAPEDIEVSRSGAHTEEAIPVIIAYGEGVETRADIVQGLMLPVGVPRQKSVTVSLLLPSTYAGQAVALRLYDGGLVGPAAPPSTPMESAVLNLVFVVASDGSVQFNFQAGAIFGLYRLLATIGSEQYLLQFYAVAPRPLPVAIVGPNPTVSPSPLPSPRPITTPEPPPLG